MRRRPRRIAITTKRGSGQGEPEPWRRTSFPSMPCGRFCPGSRPNDNITTEARVTSLSIRLEARSAAHRCYRAYAIEVATDLFGAWLVDMSYGRIGTIGRSKVCNDRGRSEPGACLPAKTRHSTAPHRCRSSPCVASIETKTGEEPTFDDQLRGWFRLGRRNFDQATYHNAKPVSVENDADDRQFFDATSAAAYCRPPIEM